MGTAPLNLVATWPNEGHFDKRKRVHLTVLKMPKKHKISVTFNEQALGLGVVDRKNKHGVEVVQVVETSEAYGLIEPGDVVTYIGEHDIRDLHFEEFKKYAIEASTRPLTVRFCRPYEQKYPNGLKVLVECEPDSDTEDGEPEQFEKARILGFNDMKGHYKIKYLDDGIVDNDIVEKEIHLISDAEADGSDEEEAEEQLSKHEYKISFRRKLLDLAVKDRKGKLGVVVHTVLETSEAFGKVQVGDCILAVGEHDIHNMHYIDFKKYVKEEADRPLVIKFFKPHTQKFAIGEFVKVECDPDSEVEDDETWENAKITMFDDYNNTYDVVYLDDNAKGKQIKENEIKSLNTIEETKQDLDEDDKNETLVSTSDSPESMAIEDEIAETAANCENQFQITFTKKSLGIGIKDREDQHGVEIVKVLNTSEASK